MTFKEWYKPRHGMWDGNPYTNMEWAWESAIKQEREECSEIAASMERANANRVDNPMLAGNVFTPIADQIRKRE